MEASITYQPNEPPLVQSLREEITFLRRKADEYQFRLLEHSREENPVTDATIRSEYNTLCASVESWVDEAIYEQTKPFRERWSEIQRVESKQGNLKFLKLYDSKRRNPSRYEPDTAGRQRLNWLGKQRYCNCVIVSLVIWHYLDLYMFHLPFPIGTTMHDRDEPDYGPLLRDIFEAMKKGEGNHGVCSAPCGRCLVFR
jgi:hypothetical protein